MTTGERIKKARLEKGYTQEELGNLIGVKKAAINKYETGVVENLKRSTIANLAKALDVDPIWLMGMNDDMHGHYTRDMQLPSELIPISQLTHHRIPVLGSMAAGEPIYDPEFPDVVVDGPLDADFALRIKGQSMEPTYLDGDLVFIKSVPDLPHDGAVAVISVEDVAEYNAAIKHVYRQEDGVMLGSDNPAYAPMVYKYADHAIRILGVPVGYLRMYK